VETVFLKRLYPTIPDEAIAAGQAIAAELGLGKA